ncbi:hypothetical protein [Kitasatospora sp. NBC_00458]|uniref:hypothetical protein n=1 Tax=Kitasatospora sp. NBC_00458 TaxID=2903568 RepID=UPI002E196E1B
MDRSIVFVHGTGVRARSYTRTFKSVSDGVAGIRPDVPIRGCFWGEAMGSSMALGGLSVPDYDGTGGGRTGDDEIAAWGVLYNDPWHELRLLTLLPPPQGGLMRAGEPPSAVFLRTIRDYAPGPELRDALADKELLPYFEEALAELRTRPELRDAARTADRTGDEQRRATARAVLAYTLAAAAEDGLDTVDGRARDDLMALLGAELATDGRSARGLLRKASAPVLLGLTSLVTRRRGRIGDTSMPFLGDILRYQARGKGVRDLIRRTVEDAPGERVTVIAHSLGGVATVDLLIQEDLPRVDQLVTVGSQAAHFYEIGALVSLDRTSPPPEHFRPRWLNIYDPRDLLSFTAAPVFPGFATDTAVDNRQPFPSSHSAYWGNPQVWEAISAWSV